MQGSISFRPNRNSGYFFKSLDRIKKQYAKSSDTSPMTTSQCHTHLANTTTSLEDQFSRSTLRVPWTPDHSSDAMSHLREGLFLSKGCDNLIWLLLLGTRLLLLPTS